MRQNLSNPLLKASWPELQRRFVAEPARNELQTWVDARFAASNQEQVFAWFVQDERGLQLAHSRRDTESIGRNYGWRTYFHGGDRDYEDLEEYLANAEGKQLKATKLSEPIFTQTTRQWVIAVSTPMIINGQFRGVVGVFVYLDSPGLIARDD